MAHLAKTLYHPIQQAAVRQRRIMATGRFLAAAILMCAAFLSSRDLYAQYESEIVSSAPQTPEFNIMGFGDVSYVSRDSSNEDGFLIGQAVAHLTASLGESFSVFGEFSATARDSEYAFEVERMIAKYDFSDLVKISAGRYHTPIGYWITWPDSAMADTPISRERGMPVTSTVRTPGCCSSGRRRPHSMG
jgi:hypothetical protein